MPYLLKNVLSERFTRCSGGGRTKHKCQAPHLSTSKFHGPLPTQGELREFEQTYAGANTPELMERYSGWSSGTIKRNKKCLVCLRSTRSHDGSYIRCEWCPRTIHFACLDKRAPHIWHEKTCPACVKRRWNKIRPVTPVQRHDQSDEDYYMQRVRRYHRWHRYNCQHIEEWQRLHDDGSLESDRRLLIEMDVTKPKPRHVNSGTKNEGDASHLGVDHNDEQPKALPDQPKSEGWGEAAGYSDPNTSRLGTDAGSFRSEHSHPSETSRQSVKHRENSRSSPAPNTNTKSSQASSQEPASVVSCRPSNAGRTRGQPNRAEDAGYVVPSVQSPNPRSGSTSMKVSPGAQQEAPSTSASATASTHSEVSRSHGFSDIGSSQPLDQESAITVSFTSKSTQHSSKHDVTGSATSHHSGRVDAIKEATAQSEKAESVISHVSEYSKISSLPSKVLAHSKLF